MWDRQFLSAAKIDRAKERIRLEEEAQVQH